MSECENCTSGLCDGCTEKGLLKGWECPVCGAGVSPFVTFCTHCAVPSLPVFYVPYVEPIYPYEVTCGNPGRSSCGL